MPTISSSVPGSGPHGSPAGSPPDSVRDRLVPPPIHPRWLAWLAPALVALFAGALRLVRLGQPPAIYFDETYYATDALALRTFGVEWGSVEDSDALMSAGTVDVWTDEPAIVMHPPFGKWMIAAGDALWGMLPFDAATSPVGWRLAAAVVGMLSVLVLARIAIRMTRSILLGSMAGLILALDGLHFTLSRIAMLDIFVMFWVLAGFACLVVDRERNRARLADLVNQGRADAWWLGMRWWRIAAGVCFGLACGTKWSALFFIAAFGLLTVAWDYGARRAAGQRRAGLPWLAADAAPAFVQVVGVAFVTYVATWSAWLFSSQGYYRDWAAQNADGIWHLVPGPLLPAVDAIRSLVAYHVRMWEFHTELDAHHDYASSAWEWLVMRTPVLFHSDWEATGCATEDATADCATVVLGIGTPVLWWLSLVALAVMLGWWMILRDWRAGAVLVGVAAGWLPWLAFPDRTMFVFYALPILPFLVLGITLAVGLLLGPNADSPRFGAVRRVVGGVVSGVTMLVILANFLFLYPVLSAEPITREAWSERMWFDTWIHGNADPAAEADADADTGADTGAGTDATEHEGEADTGAGADTEPGDHGGDAGPGGTPQAPETDQPGVQDDQEPQPGLEGDDGPDDDPAQPPAAGS
ncbi:phospholipid carrier-dependent glycosyltransferase [Lipingzhangella sp. LS1_29]|uniref:Polyprenol-phosphate-mannose--protein mannosyltransferase n=1 Tax=Lipingzhangella rawalii TaxID=2055835 RepID=A0ABU2H5S6_9ACTN|nr:phospholipid carrier-dependent glycosyltransferase [Lipingzhangella rawalii]MDS1270362.1 phospholipid carrier-dependent glycosyltransferase [Lipingzhangella rawalii]